MADTEWPNRQSNMEKAEGDREWEAEPVDQEQLVNRQPYRNGDVSSEPTSEPVLPSNDSTLNTKI